MLHMLFSAFIFKECQAFLEQPVMYTLPITGMPHTNRFSSLRADSLVLDVSDAMVNFTQCEASFLSNETALELYSYLGPIHDDIPGEHYISRHGCNVLCGTGPEFYPWRTSADAILTWVLPLLVMFLLAPFEPRQTRNAIISSIRWLGSPFISMWYILCNIQVTGRCAHMVDMSLAYHSPIEEGTEASDFRDAMLILGTMNQFLLDSSLVNGSDEQSRCAEQVLRIALFSRLGTQEETLQERRCKIATAIRTHRRGGMVPILFGLVWFIFILGLSIRNTFDNVGENAAGYNLGMGFAVSWVTPLVIGALVDRNAIATRDLRSNLNWIFAGAREALKLLHGQYNKVIEVDGLPKGSDLHISDKVLDSLPEDIFAEFAGQGRLRWHRGVAHAVLAGLEKSYAAEHDRGWLEHGELARAAMLIPYGGKGFNVMDHRLLLQAVAAFGIIYGNLGAGFLISYLTPPVGISCRAFGYLIFGTSTLAAATIEVILGSLTSPTSAARRLGGYGLLILEALNVCWLLGTTIAQTFGFYQTCFCLSTRFDGKLGYIQFDNVEINHSDLTITVWSVSAGVAGTILLTSLAYFVTEWLEQCHMNTYDTTNAQKGLLWSRRFKKVRGWLFFGPMLPVNGLIRLYQLVAPGRYGRKERMVWSS